MAAEIAKPPLIESLAGEKRWAQRGRTRAMDEMTVETLVERRFFAELNHGADALLQRETG